MREPQRKVGGKRTFVVHGHDDEARAKVETALRGGGFEPIILSKQKKYGSKTIIEKFEIFANSCNYAVVILSPDDRNFDEIDSSEAKEEQFRARQNVFIEMGWFFAFLGRENVVILVIGDEDTIEIPTDIVGCEVVFTKGNLEKATGEILVKLE